MTMAVHGMLLRAVGRGLFPSPGGGGGCVVGLCHGGAVVAQICDPGLAPAAVILLGRRWVHEAVSVGMVRRVVVVAYLRLPVRHFSGRFLKYKNAKNIFIYIKKVLKIVTTRASIDSETA